MVSKGSAFGGSRAEPWPSFLALTMGDPCGIGSEITQAAWQALRHEQPFVLLGDPALGRAVANLEEAASCFSEVLPVLPVAGLVPAVPGRPDPVHAPAILDSIERAVRLAQAGAVSGIVTNPIAKSVLKQAGFAHPGHTEFLAALTGGAGREVMMLATPGLRVVPVTIHVSLRHALDQLSTAEIVRVARTTDAALRRDFGIAAPRLAIAGLNPHAGEDGHMGSEETTIIRPAIAALLAEGIDARGPLPPDTMFTGPARAGYDAAICMYHDQALIPLKTIDMTQGVNITLGLDVIRTSPDHGTAFDIAGRGIADPSSLIAALRMAGAIARTRRAG